MTTGGAHSVHFSPETHEPNGRRKPQSRAAVYHKPSVPEPGVPDADPRQPAERPRFTEPPTSPFDSYIDAVDALHLAQTQLSKTTRDKNDRHGNLQVALSAARRAVIHIQALIEGEERG